MRRFVCFAALAALVAGCGHARLVNRSQTGGVFALEGDRNKAMEDAAQQMAAHCRGPYTIVAEGENVIGTDSAQQNETYVTKDGTVVNQGGQSTRQAIEWRVQYVCGSQGPAPGQYGAPPPGQYPPQQGAQPDPYDPNQQQGAPQPPPPPPPSGY
jgi:hypothetical protein